MIQSFPQNIGRIYGSKERLVLIGTFLMLSVYITITLFCTIHEGNFPAVFQNTHKNPKITVDKPATPKQKIQPVHTQIKTNPVLLQQHISPTPTRKTGVIQSQILSAPQGVSTQSSYQNPTTNSAVFTANQPQPSTASATAANHPQTQSVQTSPAIITPVLLPPIIASPSFLLKNFGL